MSESEREESFLQVYLDYCKEQESPDIFHLWVGITVLASVLGRKCYLDKGFYHLYPNLFTILVAGSARCRKSTAIDLGMAPLLDGVEATVVLSGKLTPEKFLREMADAQSSIAQPDGTVITTSPSFLVEASELTTFLAKQSNSEPLIHILTRLFDCPKEWGYKTKHQGSDILHDVFLCILAATTPDGIANSLSTVALNEGFGSRVLWVYQEDTTKRNPFPELTSLHLAQQKQIAAMLKERSKLAGKFTLTAEAITYYKEWYTIFMDTPPPEKRLEGMYGRKHDQILRVAMVLAGSELLTVIDEHHIDAAVRAVDGIEALAPAAFAQLGGPDSTPYLIRAGSIMQRFKRLQWAELLRKMSPCDSKTLRDVVDTLIQRGDVVRDSEKANVLIWAPALDRGSD